MGASGDPLVAEVFPRSSGSAEMLQAAMVKPRTKMKTWVVLFVLFIASPAGATDPDKPKHYPKPPPEVHQVSSPEISHHYRAAAPPVGGVPSTVCVQGGGGTGLKGAASIFRTDPGCQAREDFNNAERSCYTWPLVPVVGVSAGKCDQRSEADQCLEVNKACTELPRLREIRDLYIEASSGYKDLKIKTKKWLPWTLTWWF